MLWNNERIDSHRLFATLQPILLGQAPSPTIQ
jgi:hypothetical protein